MITLKDNVGNVENRHGFDYALRSDMGHLPLESLRLNNEFGKDLNANSLFNVENRHGFDYALRSDMSYLPLESLRISEKFY